MGGDKVGKILVVFIGQTFNLLLVFLLTPYLARSLSKDEYGTFSQVQLISTFFVALFSFGISKVFYLTLEKQEFEKADAFKTILSMTLCAGAGASLLLLLTAPLFANAFGNAALTEALILYCPFFVFNYLNIILEFNLIRSGRVRNSVLVIVLTNMIKLGLLLLAIQVLNDFYFIFITVGIIAPLAQLLMYLYMNKWQTILKGAVRKHIFRYVVAVGSPMGLTTIFATSYIYLSGFYISYFFSPAELAVYRNGSIEIPFLGIIATSVASILTPHFAMLLNEGRREEVVQVKSSSIGEVAAITYPIIILVLFFAKDFIVLYLSKKYLDSTPIFIIYTFILFIRVNTYEDVLAGLGKTKLIMYANILYFIVNIATVFIMGNLWGITGAAIASVISIYLLAFLLMRQTAIALGVPVARLIDFRKIGEVTLWALIFCLIIKSLTLLTDSLLLKGMLLAVYFVAIYYHLIRKKLISVKLYEKFIVKLPMGRSIYKIITK